MNNINKKIENMRKLLDELENMPDDIVNELDFLRLPYLTNDEHDLVDMPHTCFYLGRLGCQISRKSSKEEIYAEIRKMVQSRKDRLKLEKEKNK